MHGSGGTAPDGNSLAGHPDGEPPLPATVRTLGWTSFLTDLSSEAIYPLLAPFIRGLGGSSIDIGLVDGVANAGAAVVRLPAGVGAWSRGAASEQFLLMRATDLGVPAWLVPLVWLAINLAKSRSAAAAGRLADRWHPRGMLVAGWLVFAAAYAGLAASTHAAAAVACMLVVGVAYGLAEPAERALVSLLAPEGGHGGAFGWYTLVQGLMGLPAALLAGWLWQRDDFGPAWAFAATAILATAACGIVLASGRTAAESRG